MARMSVVQIGGALPASPSGIFDRLYFEDFDAASRDRIVAALLEHDA